MKFEFKDKHLIDLYKYGKSSKYKFLPQKSIEKFYMSIEVIENAETLQDLWILKSLCFEKLQGAKNHFSMRLDRKHRLELEIHFENGKSIKVSVVDILKISKHYK